MTGDDGRVVEGMDELEALGVAQSLQLGETLADVRAVEDDAGAVSKAGIDLRADGARRHDDGHRDAGRSTRPRVRLPRVAGRERDDPVRLGRVGQGRELVGHPAWLERTGLLEVLGLQEEAIVADRPLRWRRASRRRPSPS